jgi:hypothetical protein
VIAFFLAEMGDKTQIATVALAARYPDIVQVVLGTTFGMMLANVPAVFLGVKIARKVSMRLVHSIAAVIFAILGMLTLLNVGKLSRGTASELLAVGAGLCGRPFFFVIRIGQLAPRPGDATARVAHQVMCRGGRSCGAGSPGWRLRLIGIDRKAMKITGINVMRTVPM